MQTRTKQIIFQRTLQQNMKDYNLDRFIKAQEHNYEIALEEIRRGKKSTHWIWYIFPQIKGLGFSENSNYYGISSLDEAREYLNNPILKDRLFEICNSLLNHRGKDIYSIIGRIDAVKLKSSMTLFDLVYPQNIFKEILTEFYQGQLCKNTLKLLNME